MKHTSKQVVLLTTALSVISGQVLASESSGATAYIGAGPTLWMYANEYEKGLATGVAASLRGGVRAENGLGAEMRFMTGGSGSLGGMDIALDSAISFLGTFSQPVSEKGRAGIYLGLTSGKMTYSGSVWGNQYEVSDSDSGFTFGVQVETALTDDVTLYFDYGNYILKSEYIVQGISVGLKTTF
jgi:hypothetical protein